MTINDIKRIKQAIEKLTSWDSTGKVFGHIDRIEGMRNPDKQPDRLYEFYCFSRILEDLSKSYHLNVVKCADGKVKFPLAPGNKANFSRVVINHKANPNNGFQVCYGTEIELSNAPQTTFAPDISFQLADAPLTPCEKNVAMIYDAKYKSKNTSSLDIGTIREFIECVRSLQVTNAQNEGIKFTSLSNINSNSLLTNGETLLQHKQYCINNHMKQVGGFDCNGRNYTVVG